MGMKAENMAEDIIRFVESLRDEKQREVLMRFFKTSNGEYGEGDDFLGQKVLQTREVVKADRKDIPLEWEELGSFSKKV